MALFRTVDDTLPEHRRRTASRCACRKAATSPNGRRLREVSRAFLVPWEPTWPADDLTRGAFRRRLKRYAEDLRGDLAYAFLIFRSDDDAMVGGLTLANIRRGVAQAGSIGYWVGAPFARQGYMTAAMRALIPFCFGTLRLHRLEAACIPSNAASVGALGKDRISARRLCAGLSVHQRHLAGSSALCAAQGRSATSSCAALGLPRLPCYKRGRNRFQRSWCREYGGRDLMARIGAAVAAGLGLALALGGCGSTGSSTSSSVQRLAARSVQVVAEGDRRSAIPPTLPPVIDTDYDCPEVKIRAGAATLMIGSKPGEGEPNALDVRYQGSIMRTARECHLDGNTMTMKVGIEGRIITGPAGGPGNVDVPLRIAVVQEGNQSKVMASKFGRETVTITGTVDRANFTHIDPDVSFPLPSPITDISSYVVYIGFDPQGAAPEKKKPPAKQAEAAADGQAALELSRATTRADR